jgi:hypothetical protein
MGVKDLEKRGLRRLAAALSLASALGFWVVNAVALCPRLAGPAGAQAFLKNIAIAVTFVAGLPAAGAAFTLVLERGIGSGRDGLPGVGRKTVIFPFALGFAVVALGAAISLLAIRTCGGGEWAAVARSHGQRLLPVGAGFALMGSFAGNLAGSITLEAMDLGRWVRRNLVFLILHTAFWIFLMWAVLHILWKQIGARAVGV